jgi:hypothetical protein
MVKGSSWKSKWRISASGPDVKSTIPAIKSLPQVVKGPGPACAPLDNHPESMSVMITGLAADLAILLLGKMPRDQVEATVSEWFTGAPHAALELLEDDMQPPAGFCDGRTIRLSMSHGEPRGTNWR